MTDSIYSAFVMPHLKYCAQFGALQNKSGISKRGRIQHKVFALVKGVEYMTEESLRELILLSMEKRMRKTI